MPSTTIHIQKVSTKELLLLQKIATQTFCETFASSNTTQDMALYVEKKFSTQQLTTEIEHLHTEFYFAMAGQDVLGYIKINFKDAQTEIKDANAMEIERIYVSHAFQGKQVGQLLYEYAIQRARYYKVDYVWLGVWEHNRRAIRFYEKNGFMAFDTHVFVLGKDKQTDLLMKKDISEKKK